MSQKLLYKPSEHNFKNFFHFVKSTNIDHKHLPEIFMNRNQEINKETLPEVNFEISSHRIDEKVFVTSFTVKIISRINIINEETKQQEQREIYTIDVKYDAFTQIENPDDLSEDERKKILMVDVPYLIFPFIRHYILTLTVNMGAMPLNLNTINFEDLLQNELQNESSKKSD